MLLNGQNQSYQGLSVLLPSGTLTGRGPEGGETQKPHVLMEHSVGVNYTFCSVGEKLSPWPVCPCVCNAA